MNFFHRSQRLHLLEIFLKKFVAMQWQKIAKYKSTLRFKGRKANFSKRIFSYIVFSLFFHFPLVISFMSADLPSRTQWDSKKIFFSVYFHFLLTFYCISTVHKCLIFETVSFMNKTIDLFIYFFVSLPLYRIEKKSLLLNQ